MNANIWFAEDSTVGEPGIPADGGVTPFRAWTAPVDFQFASRQTSRQYIALVASVKFLVALDETPDIQQRRFAQARARWSPRFCSGCSCHTGR